MSAEAMAALAAAGGTAVVQAAGTDAWQTVRQRIGRLLGREDAARESAELVRLDQTQAALAAGGAAGDGPRARWEGSWHMRLEMFLDALDDSARAAAATQLAEIISLAQASASAVTAQPGGVAVGGDVNVRADNGAIAGNILNVDGEVNLQAPLSPQQRD